MQIIRLFLKKYQIVLLPVFHTFDFPKMHFCSMSKKIFLFFSLLFFVCGQCLLAQKWQYHHPAAWFDLNSVEIPSPGVIAIGGGWETMDSVQIMLQSSDYGSTWTENTHDGLAPWNKSIAFSDAQNGYGVGYDGRIIKSDDAGLNWGYQVYPVNRDLNKIIFVDGTYYVAGGHKTNDSIQTILKSSDNGITWNVIYDTLGPWLKSIFFIDTLKGFAVGDNSTILSTINGGNSWTSVPAPLQRDFNGITFINSDTGYIVGGIPVDTCRRTILQTTDGGANWNVLTDTTGGILNGISFADSLTGYIVGDSATVLKTSDGGNSWLPVLIDSSLTGTEIFYDVSFLDLGFGAIVGNAGSVYVYQDRLPEVFTMGLNQLGNTDATLSGGVNSHNKLTEYSFVYSTDSLFSISVVTAGTVIQNDSLFLVSENIQGLIPENFYYYFLMAFTGSDTVYGDTLCFYLGLYPPYSFQTADATNVSGWGAKLKGFLNKFPVQATLFFEYGTTPSFGLQVAAEPAAVNDTLMHFVSASISGLQTNQKYFFRLKGVSANGFWYGDTKIFYAVDLPWVFTESASGVTLSEAQLNGNVTNNGFVSAIKFDYGLSSYYGSEAVALPDSVIDTNYVSVSCLLTGLTPSLLYHFRVKAICANGISYGNDMIFVPGSPTAFTYSANQIGLNSVQLNGIVNPNNSPTSNKFEYGETSAYGNLVFAIPDSSTGNNNEMISFQLNGLTPGTEYHYRVVAGNLCGTTYGNDVVFFTDSLPGLKTLMASDINFSSARLRGSVDAGGVPTAVKFEYGNTASYGYEISAVPDTVSDTGLVYSEAFVSGLTPGMVYHFRIKGTTDFCTKYGNDMIFFTGDPAIPNFDFEYWDSGALFFPDDWTNGIGIIEKSSPGCAGDFALKIQNPSLTEMGVISMGFLGEGPVGEGIPFNARPDSFAACINYDIDINDTAWIALIFSKNGNPAGINIFKIAGNSGGNFIDVSYPIGYSIPDIPDSLIVVVSSSNFDQQDHSTENYLIIDDIHFPGTQLNIPNNSFELWHSENSLDLAGWSYDRKGIFPIDTVNSVVMRTPDAATGDWAAKLTTYIQDDGKGMGRLISATNKSGKFPVSYRHRFLTGYYKFFPQNNDTMVISVFLYKDTLIIGSGTFIESNLNVNYSAFEITVAYNDSVEIPDSASIIIRAYDKEIHGKSVLYIDHLNFDGFLSGIKQPPAIQAENLAFNIFPNPFHGFATLSFFLPRDQEVAIRLFDLSGKQVEIMGRRQYKAGYHSVEFSASGIPGGFYICMISTGAGNFFRKIIVQ